jgi:hypothetical protein
MLRSEKLTLDIATAVENIIIALDCDVGFQKDDLIEFDRLIKEIAELIAGVCSHEYEKDPDETYDEERLADKKHEKGE